MEEFKKNLLGMCKRSIAGPVIFLVIAVVCTGLGVLMSDTSDDPFDGTSGGYQQLDVVYVMGPFTEQTEDGRTTDEDIDNLTPQTVTGYSRISKSRTGV